MTEVIDAEYSTIEEQPAGKTEKKKSYKIPALIIGGLMIVLGIIGIAITLPNFF